MTVKILISGHQTSGGLGSSLKAAFQMIGWNVFIYDDVSTLYSRFYKLAKNKYLYRLLWKLLARYVQKQFISRIIDVDPDIILVLKGFYYSPETICSIRKFNKKCVIFYFNPDNPFNTWHFGNSNEWIKKSLAHYDVNLTWGKFLIPDFTKYKSRKTVFFPFAFDPSLHGKTTLSTAEFLQYKSDVSFIGTWDEEREWWISHILDFDIKIWGDGWERASINIQSKWQKKHMAGLHFSKICTASKINLNLIRKQNIPAHNMRSFEIPASGGFMLSTRSIESDLFWTEDLDIGCFSSPDELRSKLILYLDSEKTRVNMAKSAYLKCSSHIYASRAGIVKDEYLKILSKK